MATSDMRQHALALMQILIASAPKIGYSQVRPMATAKLHEQDLWSELVAAPTATEVISPDCSEMVTLICRMTGYKDPSGPTYDYDGFGNSATMYTYCKHYTDAAHAGLGAIVTFGPGGGDHVAMVMIPDNNEATANPTLFSHGTAAGPIAVTLKDYLTAEPQQAPATFLNVGPL